MASDKHETPPAPSAGQHPPPQPGQPGYRAPSEGRAAAPKDEKAEEELRARRRFDSIGAQVILDFNEDGSVGARGGAGGTIVENTMARDKWLYDLGLDPVAPSGPPPAGGREYLDKRTEALAKVAEEAPKPPDRATRVSSLAAGEGSGKPAGA